jgi:hypothetical protein
MKIYHNLLYLCVLSITLFSCDTPNTEPEHTEKNGTDTLISVKKINSNDRPSQKEVITYDEVLKLYTCLNKDNLIGNGENRFVWKHKGKTFELFWVKNIKTNIYGLYLGNYKVMYTDERKWLVSEYEDFKEFGRVPIILPKPSIEDSIKLKPSEEKLRREKEERRRKFEYKEELKEENEKLRRDLDSNIIQNITSIERLLLTNIYEFSCYFIDEY